MTHSGDPTLDAMLNGTWINPDTGKPGARLPFKDVRILDTTDGAEADLIAPLGLGKRLAVVSDPNTNDAMGARVARALRAIATVDEVVIDVDEATEAHVEEVKERTRHADGVVAVGSGTLQDLVKHATFLDGRKFATFATAASMNGYTSVTASITAANGFKQSLKSHASQGIFMDVEVAARAPAFLARAGLGDCLCRSTAQVDWRLSNALFGTTYFEAPFTIQMDDERDLLKRAAGVDKGDHAAIRTLYKVLTWVGLGTVFTGTSHHGSMSEHMISHWIDMFAGDDHPGTLHGHQVGYAAVSMSRLQNAIFRSPVPPVLKPTRIDEAWMMRRYGPSNGAYCLAEARAKAMDDETVARINAAFEDWDRFREPLLEVMLPTEVLVKALRDCGGYVTAMSSGLPAPVYAEALLHARDIRNRFSVLDVADDGGILANFAAREAGLSRQSLQGEQA
ncbi:iron-containing alcohol dehydrogenase [Gellertiella hungarica]|uniref:Glycerol-1-phosphate dehydrogenase [NAD(P)+] n=1 Tax=Gellertiella hungarica TaxID=1572859 RepID=A0A7W6J2R9_9HYPH|nr:iron-containing alcohol dehydrogenase [Gellertiella hungarica]MBB4063719.1 glycerol-1-phosphate dehydrogenase [NAD(P)+] [Gellertiella hungarica]